MAAFRGASAPASRRPNKPEQETARVVVPFEDNRLLTQLLGEYDSHLALIEDRLGINAHAHGNVVILTGSANSCRQACFPILMQDWLHRFSSERHCRSRR